MRYDRLEPLDVDVERLQQKTVAVVGLGATGSRIAAMLARVGVDLTVIDRDFLEEPNLATSTLYTEAMVEERLPKAVAAAKALRTSNSDIAIEAKVADLNSRNASALLDQADLVMDGTDSMETRHLLNEYCVREEVPWVHVSALESSGEVLPVVPGKTACFDCVFHDVDPSSLATCETAGISPAAASTAASIAVETAFRLLDGDVDTGLTRFDLAAGGFRVLDVARRDGCRTCEEEDFSLLEGDTKTLATAVCGEDTYQVNPRDSVMRNLDDIAAGLREKGVVEENGYLLRFEGEETFTLFQDGRMIVQADSVRRAKSLYSRYVGN